MKKLLRLTLICITLFGCQKTDIAIDEWQDNDACSNDFEQQNNTLHKAPFWSELGISSTSALTKGESDFWKFAIKANSKGKIPTQIVYDIANPATVTVAIY